jgi:hypothetical protein
LSDHAKNNKKPIADLFELFNEVDDMIRIVAILSSSCLECTKTTRVLETIYHRFGADGKLKEIIVWHPSLPTASGERAQKTTLLVSDEGGETADVFARSLALKTRALHVCLLYSPRLRWEGCDQMPPAPAFWMHHSSELEEKSFFNAERFEEETKFLIESEDPEFSEKQVSEVLLNKKKKGLG